MEAGCVTACFFSEGEEEHENKKEENSENSCRSCSSFFLHFGSDFCGIYHFGTFRRENLTDPRQQRELLRRDDRIAADDQYWTKRDLSAEGRRVSGKFYRSCKDSQRNGRVSLCRRIPFSDRCRRQRILFRPGCTPFFKGRNIRGKGLHYFSMDNLEK